MKHYSAQIEHRGQPWNDRNLGSHFFREARRLWQIEESKASLTAIQAALLICFSLNIDGKDKVGWTFVSQAVQMSQDLGLFAALPPARVNSSERNSDNLWNHARAVTAWAVFNFETCVNLGHPVKNMEKVNKTKYAVLPYSPTASSPTKSFLSDTVSEQMADRTRVAMFAKSGNVSRISCRVLQRNAESQL